MFGSTDGANRMFGMRCCKLSTGPLIAGFSQACFAVNTGVMVLFEVMAS